MTQEKIDPYEAYYRAMWPYEMLRDETFLRHVHEVAAEGYTKEGRGYVYWDVLHDLPGYISFAHCEREKGWLAYEFHELVTSYDPDREIVFSCYEWHTHHLYALKLNGYPPEKGIQEPYGKFAFNPDYKTAASLGFIPSVYAYKSALQKVEKALSPARRTMLRAQYNAPNRTMTVREMASAINYKGNSPNAQYGAVGHKISDALHCLPEWDKRGKPAWWTMLSSGARRSDGEYQWTMYPNLAQALWEAGWG